jgi:riboflavin synthase
MFTGLIAGVGRLAARDPMGGDVRLTIEVGTLPFQDVALGESIAVNGCCLTVVGFDATRFAVDASNETLGLTTLGRLGIGAPLNLDRAMMPTYRHGGLGRATRRWDDARAARWRIEAPMAVLRYIAHKGSICVDGVSLTVNAVDNTSFEVALIPHTVEHTAFRGLREGDAVNLEVDLLARYVERLLATKDMQ